MRLRPQVPVRVKKPAAMARRVADKLLEWIRRFLCRNHRSMPNVMPNRPVVIAEPVMKRGCPHSHAPTFDM